MRFIQMTGLSMEVTINQTEIKTLDILENSALFLTQLIWRAIAKMLNLTLGGIVKTKCIHASTTKRIGEQPCMV